jgi:hypothetical protein
MCNTKRKRGRGEERWLELRHELRLMEASHSSISATQRHGQARGRQPPAAGGAPAGCVARLVSMLPARAATPHPPDPRHPHHLSLPLLLLTLANHLSSN